MTYIQLGGEERPILFGFAALYAYEQRTGRKALEDFAGLAAQGANVSESFSIKFLVDLVLSGLIAGCRKLRQPEDFNEYDVAEWLGEDTALIQQVLKVFTDSFPKHEKNAAGPAKPKAIKPR